MGSMAGTFTMVLCFFVVVVVALTEGKARAGGWCWCLRSAFAFAKLGSVLVREDLFRFYDPSLRPPASRGTKTRGVVRIYARSSVSAVEIAVLNVKSLLTRGV